MYFLFEILSFLVWPVLIIGGIILAIARRRRKRGLTHHEWYKMLFFSKEDALSQLYYVIGMAFSIVALSAVNRDLGNPVSWQTITLVVSVLGIVLAYWQRVFILLPLGWTGIVVWWGAQSVEWVRSTQGPDVRTTSILVGVVLLALLWYVLGRIHERYAPLKRFSMVYSILGILFVTGIFFIFSTTEGLRGLERMTDGTTLFTSAPLAITVFLLLLAIAGAAVYAMVYKTMTIPEVVAVAIALALTLAIGFASDLDLVNGSYRFGRVGSEILTSQGMLWAVLLNVAVFAELVGLVFLGYRLREEWYINLGAVLLLIFIFVKYFDWFFTFLDKSVFFIIAGVLLFLLGWLMERGRRMMIAGMKQEAQTPQ